MREGKRKKEERYLFSLLAFSLFFLSPPLVWTVVIESRAVPVWAVLDLSRLYVWNLSGVFPRMGSLLVNDSIIIRVNGIEYH